MENGEIEMMFWQKKEIKSNKDYWKLIDSLTKEYARDTNAYYAEAKNRLEKMSLESRQRFAQYTGFYLGAAEECVWLDMACKAINDYVSDDTSLYFNLWVISRGKKVFLNALLNPDSLADLKYIPYGEAEFEQFMSLGEYSKEDLIKEEIEVLQKEIQYKNGDKMGYYTSFDGAMRDYDVFTERLIAGYDKANVPQVDMSQVESIMAQLNKGPDIETSEPFWKEEDITYFDIPDNCFHIFPSTEVEDEVILRERDKSNYFIYNVLTKERTELFQSEELQQNISFVNMDKQRIIFWKNNESERKAIIYIYNRETTHFQEIELPKEYYAIRHGHSYHNGKFYFTGIKDVFEFAFDIFELVIDTLELQVIIKGGFDPNYTDLGLYYLMEDVDGRNTLYLRKEEEEIVIAPMVNTYTAWDNSALFCALDPMRNVMPNSLYIYHNERRREIISGAFSSFMVGLNDYVAFLLQSPVGITKNIYFYQLSTNQFYSIESEVVIYGCEATEQGFQWMTAESKELNRSARIYQLKISG